MGFAVTVLGVILISAASWFNASRMAETYRWVDHTHQILSRCEEIQVDLLNIETATRGFAITGEDRFLAPYETGRARVRDSLRALLELTRDNPAQHEHAAALEPLVAEKIAQMQVSVALRRGPGGPAALAEIASGEGETLRARILTLVGEMKGDEQRLLEERRARSDSTSRTTVAIIAAGGTLSTLCVVFASWVAFRGFRARETAGQALRTANETLEERVETRTAELTAANAALKLEIAEREQAEASLREREQQLSLIADHLPGLVARLDRQLRYLFVSLGYEQLLQRPRAEVVGRTMREIVGEERTAQARPFFDRALAGKEVAFEAAVPRTGREDLHLLVRLVPDVDQTGGVRGVFVVALDISERKKAEENLRNSERRFRALIEHSSDSVSLIDAQNNILYLSPTVAAVEGYTAADLTGHNGLENTHPDDLPLIRQTVEQLLARPGVPVPVLWRRRHKEGHWIWLEGVSTNLIDDPAVGGIVTNYRDVTERKRAEATLQESERRFRTLTENLPDIVSRFDRQFRLLYANPAREALTGQPNARCLGKTSAELGATPANSALVETAIARVFATRQTERIQLTYSTPAGPTAWESTLVAENDAQGEVASVLVLSHDITERTRAEAQILEMNASLEERVAARTAQIEIVNRELEAFSYSVSHDLRAPLRHIDGFSGLLTKRASASLDEQSRHYLAVISEAARQMGRLIDDLLSFSRMGRANFSRLELDHDALVAAVIRDGQYEQTPTITWELSPLPRVTADPAMLRQVWVNLIENAVKYSGKNPHPRIEIGHRPATATQPAAFFIRDNGVGFDMRYVGKLFGVFQRLHSPEEFPGTGVGLASVQRIIHRHGGRIWAESDLGHGATFYFSLPENTA